MPRSRALPLRRPAAKWNALCSQRSESRALTQGYSLNQINVRSRLLGRHEWMPGIPFSSDQTLLFRRRKQKQNRPTRPLSERQVSLSASAIPSTSCATRSRIVERAVINRVAGLVRGADSQVVPVSREDNILIAQLADRGLEECPRRWAPELVSLRSSDRSHLGR